MKYIWNKLVKFNRHDPVYALFSQIQRVRPAVLAMLIGLVHIIIWIASSVIVYYSRPAGDIVYFWDLDEFTFGLFLWGVFVPIVWWFYLSFPRFCKRTIETLKNAGLVQPEIASMPSQGSFTLVSIVLALFVGSMYLTNAVSTEIELGRTSFWFITPWSLFLIVLLVTLNAYVFIQFILNTLVFSYRINMFFQRNGVLHVQLFHVDRCGGFGPMGSLAMRLSSIAVLAGVWAVWYTLIPVMVGARPNFSASTLMIYAAYAILAPTILLSLTWSLHRAMRAYKLNYKGHIGEKLESVFNAIAGSSFELPENNKTTDENVKRYQNLLELYERADTLPVWPISLINFRKFTVFASLPGVIGFASFVFDMLEIYRIVNRQ